jgi:hypothetical protein
MNKELEAQLASTLKDLTNTAGQIKDFTMEQVPDVIHQWLLYALIDNIMGFIFGSLLIWLSYMTATKWSDQTKDHWGDWSESKMITTIFGGLLSVGSLFFVVENLSNIFKIIIAPKLYIIQHIASIIK